MGGVNQTVIYGYVKPDGVKHDGELRKDPAAEPIIKEMFCRLEADASYAEIADWLNERCVPTGLYCRQKRWSGKMVRRFVHPRYKFEPLEGFPRAA